MKLGPVPENLVDRLALAAGVVPTPMLETLGGMGIARLLVAAADLGVFEALADGPLTPEALAEKLGASAYALRKAASALTGLGYFRAKGDRIALTPAARRWLLRSSPLSQRDHLDFFHIEMRWISHLDTFLRTGEPVQMHQDLRTDEWGVYQRAMRAGARLAAPEVVRRVRVPRGAKRMLDVGGAHGLFSVAFCRRHRGLESTVLDLPEAVRTSAPLLAAEGMGARVVHREGDALQESFEESAYDFIFIGHLIHHFNEDENRALLLRLGRALRPGGALAIMDLLRPSKLGEGGQLGALSDLLFAVTSRAGTWSSKEVGGWLRAAGLKPERTVRLLTLPSGALFVGRKPRL